MTDDEPAAWFHQPRHTPRCACIIVRPVTDGATVDDRCGRASLPDSRFCDECSGRHIVKVRVPADCRVTEYTGPPQPPLWT